MKVISNSSFCAVEVADRLSAVAMAAQHGLLKICSGEKIEKSEIGHATPCHKTKKYSKFLYQSLATPVALASGLVLSGCTGGMIASVMPGQSVVVEGVPFTVSDSPTGVTLRNFETGISDPALLLTYAATAAERVTGCPVTTITKDTGVNTYHAALACPPV